MASALSTNTTIFNATERHVQGSDEPAIDPHGAYLKTMGRPEQTIAIAAPDGAAQTVRYLNNAHCKRIDWFISTIGNTLLARSITSSSVSNAVTQMTGPKISSCMQRESSLRLVMTVGWKKQPCGRHEYVFGKSDIGELGPYLPVDFRKLQLIHRFTAVDRGSFLATDGHVASDFFQMSFANQGTHEDVLRWRANFELPGQKMIQDQKTNKGSVQTNRPNITRKLYFG